MFLRNIIFGIKSRLMPTISGEEAQQSLVDAVMGGGSLLWLRALGLLRLKRYCINRSLGFLCF